MSGPAGFTMFDVFEEVDGVVYTFVDEAALEAWAIDGQETYANVRPATPADRVTDAELYAWMDGSA